MEAKTKRYITQEILNRYPGTAPEIDIDWDMVEISFKAGYDKALGQLAEMTEECKQMGRQEVMEWGDVICMEHGMRKRRRCDKCWQAKSKEWGL